MPCPKTINFRIGGICLWKFKLSGLFHFNSFDTAAQSDVAHTAAVVTSIDSDRSSEIQIGDGSRLNFTDFDTVEFKLQIGGKRPNQFLPKCAGLSCEVIARG